MQTIVHTSLNCYQGKRRCAARLCAAGNACVMLLSLQVGLSLLMMSHTHASCEERLCAVRKAYVVLLRGTLHGAEELAQQVRVG